MLLSNAMVLSRFLRPIHGRGVAVAAEHLARALPLAAAGLALCACGAALGLPERSRVLDHLLKVVEFYALAGALGHVVSAGYATFWRRCNTAVHRWIEERVFAPPGERLPAGRALLGAFAFSGLVHEFVFLPGGRPGWQALFFLTHGAGVVLERQVRLRFPNRPRALDRTSALAFVVLTSALFFAGADPVLRLHDGLGASILHLVP
jgi:hypothetical protein